MKIYKNIRKIKDEMIENIHYDGLTIYNSNLSGYNFSFIKNPCSLNFYGCNLSDATFGSNIRELSLLGCNLENLNFENCRIDKLNIRSNIDDEEYWDSINVDKDNYVRETFIKIDKKYPIKNKDWFSFLNPFLEKLYPDSCPKGEFLGYKIAGDYLVTLKVPKYTKRMPNVECIRVSRAEVVSIKSLKNEDYGTTVHKVPSDYNSAFVYTEGELVSVKNFDTYTRFTSSNGIHLFLSEKEALDYYIYKNKSIFDLYNHIEVITLEQADY